jgi:hypothetical protein
MIESVAAPRGNELAGAFYDQRHPVDEFGPSDEVEGGEHTLEPDVDLGRFFAGRVAQPHPL